MSHILNHLVTYADQVPSPNRGGTIVPKFVVGHYTATWDAASAIRTLTTLGTGVSAHFVIDRDGTITQLLPCNVKGWHAGPSAHGGYSGLNSHSVGIELVNIGPLRRITASVFEAHTGEHKNIAEIGAVEEHAYARYGSGQFFWQCYTRAQLDAMEELCLALDREYGIREFLGHEEIDTRGWKTDPGPAFPYVRFRKLFQPRDTDVDEWEVTASVLNARTGPGTEFSIIGSYTKGRVLPDLGRHGSWMRVSDDRWVHSAYLRMV